MATRRDFMRYAGRALGLAAGWRFARFGMMNAMAAPATDYKALVCVFLFGGNDANNMLIPVTTSNPATNFAAYQAGRGPVALQTSDIANTEIASTQGQFALHPNLAEMYQLYSQKTSPLALVANVGTLVSPTTKAQYQKKQVTIPDNLFSHLDQQNQWQSDITSQAAATGWAGRAADLLNGLSINGGSQFPMVLSVAGNTLFGTGQQTNPAVVIPKGTLGLSGLTQADPRYTQLYDLLLSNSTGLKLVQSGNTIMKNGIDNANLLNVALSHFTSNPLKTQFPATGLGSQMQQIANIIRARTDLGMNRQIFFASLGGFDTHSTQISQHVTLFTQLSQALAAFYNATVELGVQSDVTTFTESDFSRTFKGNTNSGTDHAWGSHHIVMGGAVKGGNIYGQFPDITTGGANDTGNIGQWIPTTSLDQYGATMANWFGVPSGSLAAVFPHLPNFPANAQTLTFLG